MCYFFMQLIGTIGHINSTIISSLLTTFYVLGFFKQHIGT